jgi:hypothetical protein
MKIVEKINPLPAPRNSAHKNGELMFSRIPFSGELNPGERINFVERFACGS